MRFSGNIFLYGNNNKSKIPINYRRNISSLIKEAINKGDKTEKVYKEYL